MGFARIDSMKSGLISVELSLRKFLVLIGEGGLAQTLLRRLVGESGTAYITLNLLLCLGVIVVLWTEKDWCLRLIPGESTGVWGIESALI
jgi:hypothetical protein